jgi:beta-ketoacyl-acyl-carrier-protein synthase II
MSQQRAVITGMGAITCLGLNVRELWSGLIAGHSGIRKITQFDASAYPCQIAGEIEGFYPEDYMDRKEARRIPRTTQTALASPTQAIQDAGLAQPFGDPERVGVVFGSAIGGLDRIDEALLALRKEGYTRVNPFTIPAGLPNLSAFIVAQNYQCLGPNITIATACATGSQVIGEAVEFVRRGSADVVIAGGAEALVRDFTIGGFLAMRALPVNFNDRPQAASRPFDLNREGFVFSEGAGAMVIESLEHAQARGARIYAEVAGHASSTDAFHMAAPDPRGLGPAPAMRWALRDAGLPPEAVDYINAHGSSTPLNDITETKAIKDVFGDHAYQVAVSSTKSMLGHAMGASGMLEAIACVMAIVNGCLPPTINYETPDPECDLDYVPNVARRTRVDVAMSNSFGFGGTNATLVFKKYIPN